MGLLGTPHHHIALLLSDSVAANGKESLEPKEKKKKRRFSSQAYGCGPFLQAYAAVICTCDAGRAGIDEVSGA